MIKPWVTRRLWAFDKWLVVALLASLQLACSSGSENVLIYDPNSNINPLGPGRAVDSTNFIEGGGAEFGIDNWSYQGDISISQSAAQAHSGRYSLLVAGRTASWHGPRMNLPRDLPVGEDYLVTAWVRLAGNTPQSELNITVKRQVAGADQFRGIDSVVVPVGQWVMLAGTYTHEVAADDGGDFYVYLESPNSTASFYVDDLALRRSNLAINGGLEDGTTGWARFGEHPVIAQVSTPVRSGNHSLSVTGRRESWQGASFTFAPLDRGATYNFSCWVRLADTYSNNTVTLSLKLDDEGEPDEGQDAKYPDIATANANAQDWTQVTGSYTYQPEGVVTELLAYIQAGHANAAFFVDDCSVSLAAKPEVVVPDPSEPPAGSDWIINGDVEAGTEAWTGVSGSEAITQSSTHAHSGMYSLLVANRSASWHGVKMDLPTTLPRGDASYVASVWVRLAEGAEASEVTLSLKRRDGPDDEEDSEYINIATATATSDAWTRLRGIYLNDLPEAAVLEQFYLYIESANVTASYYVDDLTLRRNLALNGGVENASEGWQRWGSDGHPTIIATNEQARRGSYSLHVTDRGASWHGASFSVFQQPVIGGTYELSCWVRLESPAEDTVKLTVKQEYPDGACTDNLCYKAIGQVAATNTGWREVIGTYVHEPVAALGELLRITPYLEAEIAATNFYIDDCSVNAL